MDDKYIQFHEWVNIDGTLTKLPHPILDRIKGAVALEYEESGLWILVEHSDRFEWLGVTACIPAGSDREYVPESENVKRFR